MDQILATASKSEREIASAGMLALLFSPVPFDISFDTEFDQENKSDILHYSGTVCSYNSEREVIDMAVAYAEFDAAFGSD